jgi:hypothetical protein
MNIAGDSIGTVNQQPSHHPVLSDSDIDRKAGQILSAGEQMFTDNYEERMDVFAREMAALDPDSRAELFDKILEKDPGALDSWLQMGRLDMLVDEGRITNHERSQLLEGFAQAYNEGKIDLQQAEHFINFLNATQQATSGNVGELQKVNEFMSMLQRNNSVECNEFVEKFSRDALQQYVLHPPGPVGDLDRGARAGLLLNMLERESGTSSVHAALNGLNAGDRSKLRDYASDFGGMYAAASEHGLDVQDPMAIYTNTIAMRGSDAEAVELAQYVNEHSQGSGIDNKYYDSDNKPRDQRAEALSNLFLEHQDAILNKLTEVNPAQVPGSPNDRQTRQGDNLATLSNLVRMTGLNPDNSQAKQVMDAISGFVNENIRIANNAEGSDVNGNGKSGENSDVEMLDAAKGRTAMMGAVMQDAVSSGYADLRNDQQAREGFIGFIADVAMSAVPLGSVTSRQIADKVSTALGGVNNATLKQALEDALTGIPDHLLTTAEGGLTDAAKQAIVKALPPDYQYLEGIKDRSNTFIQDTILNVYVRGYEFTESMSDYRDYIDHSRGK